MIQTMIRKYVLLFLTLGSMVFASACVYRLDVQQGNEITPEMIASVKPGMTRREVVKVLGYPLVNDPFNRNRWDYFYSFKSGRTKEITRRSAKLYFEGDYLTSIDSNIVAENTANAPTPDDGQSSEVQ